MPCCDSWGSCAQVLRALVSEKRTLMGLQRQLRDRMQQLKEGCPLETLYV